MNDKFSPAFWAAMSGFFYAGIFTTPFWLYTFTGIKLTPAMWYGNIGEAMMYGIGAIAIVCVIESIRKV